VATIVNRANPDKHLADAELVQRVRGGTSSAFAELIERYQDRVYNTCYRMCSNDADALDLTQTTFVRALESLDQFAGRSSFYTWIFRIAVNLVLTHRRHTRRRPHVSLDSGTGDTPPLRIVAEDDDPAMHVERHEAQEQLQAALASLDDEFRAAVVLKDIEGFDYARIAEVLDVPIGTVKSRIHRGRLMLRDRLTAERNPVDRPASRPSRG
jgi:RNA polymerase sigma-70 factor (ECF subfamily)